MSAAEAPAPPADDDAGLQAAIAAARARAAAREEPATSLGEQTRRWSEQLPAEQRAAYEAARAAARSQEYAQVRAERDRADQAEAIAAMRAAQDEARTRVWERSRPSVYADAAIANLKPQQDPGGKISGWLQHGGQNLLIVGPSRHGKSYAAYALGNAARAAGTWVLAWSAPSLLDAIRPSAADGGTTALHHALTCELLIVDDLGRDRETDWTRERLYLIFETRLTAGLRTIVDTNESYDDLVDRYGDPIVQRILENGTVARVEGIPLSSRAPW